MLYFFFGRTESKTNSDEIPRINSAVPTFEAPVFGLSRCFESVVFVVIVEVVFETVVVVVDVVVVVEVVTIEVVVLVDVATGTSMISSPSLFTEILPFAFI